MIDFECRLALFFAKHVEAKMPLKLSVGISKKVGLPSYSSLGASCHVEVELDQSLVFDDQEGFQLRVKKAYVACSHAVAQELARQQQSHTEANGKAGSPSSSDSEPDGVRTSQKQLDYMGRLAGQIRGLGSQRLDQFSEHLYSKPTDDLSSADASGLINMLKDIIAGKIELASALNGASAC